MSGYKNIIVIGFRSYCFCSYFLLASRSCMYAAIDIECSYTSLGHDSNSKSRANRLRTAGYQVFSGRYRLLARMSAPDL